jgi:hypothetical protein
LNLNSNAVGASNLVNNPSINVSNITSTGIFVGTITNLISNTNDIITLTNSSAFSNVNIKFNNNLNSNAFIGVGGSTTSTLNTSYANNFFIHSQSNIILNANNNSSSTNSHLFISTNGSIGIGTNSPVIGTSLDVRGQLWANSLNIVDTANYYPANQYQLLIQAPTASADANIFTVQQNVAYNKNLLLQQYGGNVAIGTNIANFKLDVAGSIRAFNGNIAQGYATLNAGNTTQLYNSGYVAFFQPISGNVRAGYVGLGTSYNSSYYLLLETENNFVGYYATGNIVVNNNLYVGGSIYQANANTDLNISQNSGNTTGGNINLTAFGANGNINFNTNGANNRITILANGNVGINTNASASITYNLTVNGTIGILNNNIYIGTGTYYGGTTNLTSANNDIITLTNSSAFSNVNIKFNNNLNSNAFIGIGGSTTSTLNSSYANNFFIHSQSNIILNAGSNSSITKPHLFISTNGNIGIGTSTNINSNLTINGSISASDIKITGTLTAPIINNPNILHKYGISFICSTSITVNSITYYKYDINLTSYTKTLLNGSSTPYRIFRIKIFNNNLYFQNFTNNLPNILNYEIYMSNNSTTGPNGEQSGINICAIGSPENYYLSNILPTNNTLIRTNNFDYLSVISVSNNITYQAIIEDLLN